MSKILTKISEGFKTANLVNVLLYVRVSENWQRMRVGLESEMEARPISPRALPRPSTIATKHPGTVSVKKLALGLVTLVLFLLILD